MRGHRGAVGRAYTHVEDGANVRCIVRAEANDAVVRRTPAATGRVGHIEVTGRRVGVGDDAPVRRERAR